MSESNVLNEIVLWSTQQPEWQRDALRRLVTHGRLAESDLMELAEICKCKHGLAEGKQAIPVGKTHIAKSGKSLDQLKLVKLTHHSGVNALSPEQTIEFGPALTIVYGANAAGKSGYTRILKQACRARGSEDILGNVMSKSAPDVPTASIGFEIDGEQRDFLWKADGAGSEDLGRVSVFDRHCASVYVSEKTDVAFRPLGLDLFDKLSDACESVKKILDDERKELERAPLCTIEGVSETSEVGKQIANLTPMSDPKKLQELANVSDEERKEIERIKIQIAELASQNPEKESKLLEIRSKRINELVRKVTRLQTALSDSVICELAKNANALATVEEEIRQSNSEVFDGLPISISGESRWRELWFAASAFSAGGPYKNQTFPVVEPGSFCVFCMQEISPEAAERLVRFGAYFASTIQKKRDFLTKDLARQRKEIETLDIPDSETDSVVVELKTENAELGEKVSQFLLNARNRRDSVLSALGEAVAIPTEFEALKPLEQGLQYQADHLDERAKALTSGDAIKRRSVLVASLTELEDRGRLSENLESVLAEITRRKKIATYLHCIEDTKTGSITRKSTEVTKRAVTTQLASCFLEELKELKFQHIEVELASAGGSRGSLFHRLQFRRAPRVSVPDVASEGETRCLSIAAFFSELSTTEDRAAILFDDPVSSLDHNWRENVARRLVLEARDRQVIVFTHDIVFLLALKENAEELKVELRHQYLRREPSTGAGCSSQQLPWAAKKVKDRVGHLKSLLQNARAQFNQGHHEMYEQLAAPIYGLLRESWERAIEEVLLGGVVERYRKSIQTQQINRLSDIAAEDCQAIDNAMTKCSKWMQGHDQSPADNSPFPDPDELDNDIKSLESWVKRIRTRRQS